MARPFHGWLLCGLLAAAAAGAGEPSTPSMASESAARSARENALLSNLKTITTEQGENSPAAIQPLLELGGLYVEQDRCEDAIKVLTKAVQISRASNGLFNAEQTELAEPRMECYLALDLVGDFAREQRYSLLIAEKTFGKDDVRALGALTRIAQWYGQAGWYISARELYQRAADIARKAGSEADLQRAEALRAIANSFRLEYTHGIEPIDADEHRGSRLRSVAQLRGVYTQLDRLGEDSLKQAIAILRARGDEQRPELVDTLLELGDWYQMGYAQRDALRIYKEAWVESQGPGYTGAPLFTKPSPVLYQAQNSDIALRRPPPERENYTHYSVKFDFTVTAEGEVTKLKVVESNAPDVDQWRMTDSFAATRFRPRFVEGQPVATEHVTWRQGMWVETRKKRVFSIGPAASVH